MDQDPVVNTYSEAWRRECEARHVCSLPTLKARRLYIIGVLEHRGEVATQQLEADVRIEWAKQGVAPSPLHAPTKKRGPKPPKTPASDLFSQ
ncbi:MAG: hypothetical protein ACK52V_15345 [Betaproteobacteria bacterium]